MIKTYGLTHIALAVRNAEQSSRFYRDVFGAVEVFRGDGFIQVQTPGSRDVIVFDENAPEPGHVGGMTHFGFRLVGSKFQRPPIRRFPDSPYYCMLGTNMMCALGVPGNMSQAILSDGTAEIPVDFSVANGT